MRITENNANRYINLLSSGSASGNNALKVSISDETFRAEREKAWQNEPLTVSAGSYIPNITYNTADAGESIEKVSIADGCCNDADKTREYLQILKSERDSTDYSGMGGGEIINSIIDRYKKYFDYDGDLSHLEQQSSCFRGISGYEFNALPRSEKERDWSTRETAHQIVDEINGKLHEYNINQEQAWIEYYGYDGMTNEEMMSAIVHKYSDNGFTYDEAHMMNKTMLRTGCIDNKTWDSIESDLLGHEGLDIWRGIWYKGIRVNFNSLLSDSYKKLEQGYSGLGMSEKNIEFIKEQARLRISFYEEILNILGKEEI